MIIFMSLKRENMRQFQELIKFIVFFYVFFFGKKKKKLFEKKKSISCCISRCWKSCAGFAPSFCADANKHSFTWQVSSQRPPLNTRRCLCPIGGRGCWNQPIRRQRRGVFPLSRTSWQTSDWDNSRWLLQVRPNFWMWTAPKHREVSRPGLRRGAAAWMGAGLSAERVLVTVSGANGSFWTDSAVTPAG